MTTIKQHTTNYFNTFIEVAEDTKVSCGKMPLPKGNSKTIAEMQYELIAENPYKFTSDDIFFKIHANRSSIAKAIFKEERDQFFSIGRPCFRASPLTKTYGFGVHANSEGKIALYGVETAPYKAFLKDSSIKKVKAMRTAKK